MVGFRERASLLVSDIRVAQTFSVSEPFCLSCPLLCTFLFGATEHGIERALPCECVEITESFAISCFQTSRFGLLRFDPSRLERGRTATTLSSTVPSRTPRQTGWINNSISKNTSSLQQIAHGLEILPSTTAVQQGKHNLRVCFVCALATRT